MCGTVRSGQLANVTLVPPSWVANRQATKCGGDSYLTLRISIMFTELGQLLYVYIGITHFLAVFDKVNIVEPL